MKGERALEKLRVRLARRGITSTATVVGLALTNHAVIAAPAALVSSVASLAIEGSIGLASSLDGMGTTTFKTMSTLKLVLGTATAAALFGIGAYVGGYSVKQSFATERNESQTKMSEARAENAQLKSVVSQLRTDEAARKTATPISAVVREKKRWEVLAELSAEGLVAPRVGFIGAKGQLNPKLATLFDLTADEETSLSYQIAVARDKLGPFETANAVVTRRDDGAVIIEINAFAQAGLVIQAELMAGIAKALGKERNAAFATFCGNQIETIFSGFGMKERKIVVTRKSNPQGKSYYQARIETATSHGSTGMIIGDRDSLQYHLGAIVNLIPADF